MQYKASALCPFRLLWWLRFIHVKSNISSLKTKTKTNKTLMLFEWYLWKKNYGVIHGTKGTCIAIIKMNECVLPFCGFVLPSESVTCFFVLHNHQMEKSAFIPEVRSGFSAASAGLCCLILFCSVAHNVLSATYCTYMFIYKIPAFDH